MSDGGETDERRTVRYRRPRDSCQSKSSTVPRISHWPRPRQRWIGSVALLLFESRWWGKAGVRSPWIGSRLRVVRAHFQNYRPWRHIERCAHRVGPRASLSSAAQSLPWPSPPPPVSQISISRGIGTTPFIPKYAKRCRWTVLSVSTRLSDKTGRREVNLGWSTVNN